MRVSDNEYPAEFLAALHAVRGLRARRVIDHILKHGHITTEELKDAYGYNHPPRAAQDVRDNGIPIVMKRVMSTDHRSISAYTFGDPADVRADMLGGRQPFSKAFRLTLSDIQGGRCAICAGLFDARYLQIDHKIPYQVAGYGDSAERDVSDFMLVCGSCNRAKSWSCEHCENGIIAKDIAICGSCYWADPLNYKHIATILARRLDVMWQGDEVAGFELLRKLAAQTGEKIPDFVKRALREHIDEIST